MSIRCSFVGASAMELPSVFKNLTFSELVAVSVEAYPTMKDVAILCLKTIITFGMLGLMCSEAMSSGPSSLAVRLLHGKADPKHSRLTLISIAVTAAVDAVPNCRRLEGFLSSRRVSRRALKPH